MAEKIEVEVFVAINEDGDWAADSEAEVARDQMFENFGGYACRIVKLKLLVTPPSFEEPIATIDVPDEAGVTAAVEMEA
jgi:hypothetical protein